MRWEAWRLALRALHAYHGFLNLLIARPTFVAVRADVYRIRSKFTFLLTRPRQVQENLRRPACSSVTVDTILEASLPLLNPISAHLLLIEKSMRRMLGSAQLCP